MPCFRGPPHQGWDPGPLVCPALEAGSLPLAPDLCFLLSSLEPLTGSIVMDSLNCPHTCVAKILKFLPGLKFSWTQDHCHVLNLGLKIQVLRAPVLPRKHWVLPQNSLESKSHLKDKKKYNISFNPHLGQKVVKKWNLEKVSMQFELSQVSFTGFCWP